MNNIILIGFMGCGKTSTGIRLSYRLHRVFEDTDKIIEREYKMGIPEIFERYGEEAFRRMETECLKKLVLCKEKKILSVGGGLAVRPENRSYLKLLGTVAYLKVTPETVYERLKDDATRPLLQGVDTLQRIEELMRERREAYEQAADVVIEADGLSVDEAAEQVREAVKAYRNGLLRKPGANSQ